MSARFFKSGDEFRRWLQAHHATDAELVVGFYRKSSGKDGISYQEAVDEALCFGWIDGVKRKLDDERYTHRFSPRKAVSTWSVVNTRRAKELIALKRMAKPGLDAWKRRDPKRTGTYSFERRNAAFDAGLARTFKRHTGAWTFFRAQPPGYQKLATFFVVSAKQPRTREQRLARLIACSAEGKRLQ